AVHHTPRCFVGQAEVADLAFLDQASQLAETIFQRHRVVLRVVFVFEAAEEVGAPVGPVQLVEIDVVGLQPAQAGLERVADLLWGQAPFRAAGAKPVHGAAPGRLAEQHHFVAPAVGGQPPAEIFLAAPLGFGPRRHRVHLCGINEVNALIQRVIDLCMRVGFAILLAPGHAAQAQGADLDIAVAELAVFHGDLLSNGYAMFVWRRCRRYSIIGPMMISMAMRIFVPGTTIVLGRDMCEPLSMASRYGKSIAHWRGSRTRITTMDSSGAGTSRAKKGSEVS